MSTGRAAVSAKYAGRLPLTLDADRSVGSAEPAQGRKTLLKPHISLKITPF